MPVTKITAAVGALVLAGLTYLACTGVDSLRGPVFGGWALVVLIVGGSKAFPPTRPLPKFKQVDPDARPDGEA